MSIVYIGQSQAKPEEIDTYRNFLMSVVTPAVQSSEGANLIRCCKARMIPPAWTIYGRT